MQSTDPIHFQIGQLYSNDEISTSLGVGNAGGIRPSLRRNGGVARLVLMTAIPDAKVASENPYHDRVEGDVLIYTGSGLQGNQEPKGLNRRLVEQSQHQFPIWCFRQEFSRRNKASGKRRWRFLGLLALLRYYQERQIDSAQALRKVWVFEFNIVTTFANIQLSTEAEITANVFSSAIPVIALDRSPAATEVVGDDLAETQLELLRGRMLSLDPRSFELLIETVLVTSGYEGVAVTRYSQDGGIDVNASFGSHGWPASAYRVQIQAKRWLHTVGRKEVAELRGSLQSGGIGCLITTSHFSKAALAEASENGKSPITLVNGRQMAELLRRLKINPINNTQIVHKTVNI